MCVCVCVCVWYACGLDSAGGGARLSYCRLFLRGGVSLLVSVPFCIISSNWVCSSLAAGTPSPSSNRFNPRALKHHISVCKKRSTLPKPMNFGAKLGAKHL